jgi:hypothetical protein
MTGARKLPVWQAALEIDGPLMRSSHCHCRAVPEGTWRAIPHAGARRRRRYSPSRRRGACLGLRVDTGHAARILLSVRRASAGEIRRTLAQTDPGSVALHGVALATLDDDPGVRLDARTRLSPTRLRGSRSPTICPNTRRVSSARRSPQFLTGRSHVIAVRAATLSVCWSFGEGTFAGKQGDGQDAPRAVIR